jgi:lipid II:glycine glycyltransferase (peptidoglycan interpeptide bridge formation enzyme)
LGIQLVRTRALPGARIVRVPRFGRGLSDADLATAVDALRSIADETRVVRVHVEIYADDPDEHAAIERMLSSAGFSRTDETRSYTHTLWMDLEPSEDDLLSGIHRSARRNVRLPARRGFVIEPLGQGTSVQNLSDLYAEAFESTGSDVPVVDWGGWLELATRRPDLLHMVGMRHEEEAEWIGFAVGVSHGDVVEYHHAASTRRRETNVPLLYSPLWELIRWGKSCGARWFDFGGVTIEHPDGEDPLAGISDFKRFFCRTLVEVGGEWTLDPPSVAGRLWKTARLLKDAAAGG